MVNLAIVGGNFGIKCHLPAFKKLSNVNIVSILSRSKDSYLDIVNDKNIDAVSIALPPEKSFDLIKLCLINKKHIFCEKPVCANLNQANEISSLLSDELIHAVDFEICESKVINYLKKIINDFGEIKSFDFSWRLKSPSASIKSWKNDVNQGGGVLFNYCSHVFNLLEYLFSKQIINLTGNILPNLEYNTSISSKVYFSDFYGNIDVNVLSENVDGLTLKIYYENATLILSNNTNKLCNFNLIKDVGGIKEIISFENNTSDEDGRINLIISLADRFINGIILKSKVSPNIKDAVRVHVLADILLNT
jgi:predicted dehydrogenase